MLHFKGTCGGRVFCDFSVFFGFSIYDFSDSKQSKPCFRHDRIELTKKDLFCFRLQQRCEVVLRVASDGMGLVNSWCLGMFH